jgi:hypothetical protein
MKIVHRISMTVDADVQRYLHRFGVEIKQGSVTFELDESSVPWPEFAPILSERCAVDMASTKFTAAELREAAHLEMVPTWHHGYPQPEDDFEYLEVSYDLASYCAMCGMGAHQVAPLHMKREPRWGKKHILQLNWVYDEYFVLPDIWQSVFKPFGVGCMPVVQHRTGKKLETVVQLDVATTASSPLQLLDDQPSERCDHCNRRKYLPICRGAFPEFAELPDAHILKTREYFGSGASADKGVIVSADLFGKINDLKVRGVGFIPCLQSLVKKPVGSP